jgi:arsenic resistance protein ArsH
VGARKTHKARVLVLYGSLRENSFSRQLAFECARLLELMGADVRVFNPNGLPLRDPTLEDHPKVG